MVLSLSLKLPTSGTLSSVLPLVWTPALHTDVSPVSLSGGDGRLPALQTQVGLRRVRLPGAGPPGGRGPEEAGLLLQKVLATWCLLDPPLYQTTS